MPRPTPRRILPWLFAAFGLLALTVGIVCLTTLAPRSGEPGSAVARALLRRHEDPRGRPEVVAELAAAGVEARVELVRLALGDASGLGPEAASEWVVSPRAFPELAGEALALLAARSTCDVLAAEFARDAFAGHEAAALSLLAASESSVCARLAWDLARGLAPRVLEGQGLDGRVEAALTTAFRADGETARAALRELEACDPRLGALVLAALAGAGRAELAEEVARLLLAEDNALTSPALHALVQLERRAPFELAGRSRQAYLQRATTLAPLERAQWLVELTPSEDPELAALLLALPRDERRVLDLVREGLEVLARSTLSDEPADWDRWHAAELAWLAARFEPALAEFTGSEAGAARSALRELSRHPLFRRASAARLAGSLEQAPAEVVRETLLSLGALGSWAAVPGLELALDLRDASLRELAADTLELLTGTKVVRPE